MSVCVCACVVKMEEFLGPQAEYDEEEEERKYYRRKRLGVIKNVVAASVGGMIVYSVYMGGSCCATRVPYICCASMNETIGGNCFNMRVCVCLCIRAHACLCARV